MDPFIITLIVPAASGLAFLAYKHPKGYGKLAIGIAIVTLTVGLVIIAFNLGAIASTSSSLSRSLANNNQAMLKDVEYDITHLQEYITTIKTTFIVLLLINTYSSLLTYLPKILGLKIGKTT